MDPLAILGMFGGGIAAMWWYFRASNDARILDLKAERDRDRETWAAERTRLESEIAALETKIDAQNATLAKNTDALTKAAESQEQMVGIIRQFLDPPAGT
jgi:hypothetical protein